MISEKLLRELYAETAQSYRKELDESQFKAWDQVLAPFNFAQISGAIALWRADATVEDTGWVRGARMPQPAEIKSVIERMKRVESQKTQNHFVPCRKNGCEDGWIREFTGVTKGTVSKPEGNPVDPKLGAVRRCECFKEWAATRKSA